MRIAMLLHKSVEFDSRVRREAGSLAAAGHDVHVLELAPVPADGAWLDGFRRVSCLPPGWVRRRLPSPLYRSLMLLYFMRGIVDVKPEVVHAHDAAMLLPGLFGARLTGAQLVYDSHELASSVPYRERSWAWFVTSIERLVVPRCAAVITVSDGIATRLRERYRLAVTPTVVRNVSALVPGGRGGLRMRLGLGPETPLVLHQGAPAPDRGCESLVEAVAQLEGVHVAFLGDPEPGYGQGLLALITALGIHDRVSFLPSVPLKELLAWTAEADIGVTLLQDTCENHRLALPNKLFEYITAGVPVVASALPEVERLVNEYDVGWCVAPGDVTALVSTLDLALRARGEASLRERLATAARDLRWPREQTRLVDLYRRLAQNEGREPDVLPPVVLLLVRNAISNDARVLRAARTAETSHARALVVGVAAEGGPAGVATVDGITVVRVSPWSRTGLLGRFRRGRPAGTVGAGPVAAGSSSGSVPRLTARVRLRRSAAGLAFMAQAIAIARRERPAVVHSNDWNTMWAALAIKLLCGARLVYDSHELWPDRNGRWESRPWLVAAEALFVRVADEVVTTSPGHAQAIAHRYRVREPLVVRNIPEWVATDLTPPPSQPIVMYVGGLMPGRGLEQMIDALPELTGVTLRAVGPGAAWYRAQLLERAAATGVADRVELRRPVDPAGVRAELGQGSIGLCLIQPICRSYALSLPNKLLEYVAAGLPILGSDLPVIGRLVSEHHLGEVVPPDDPRAIAAGVGRLLEPARHADAVRALRAYASANTWAAESQRLADLYAAASNRSGRG